MALSVSKSSPVPAGISTPPRLRVESSSLLRLAIAALCGSFVTIAALLLWQRLGSDPGVPEEQILAVVGGQPITLDDWTAEMKRRGGAKSFATADARRGLLDDMVRVEVLAANARARGYLEEYGVRRDFEHILAGRYRQEEIEPQLAQVEVSDDEAAAYYHANPQRFTVPAAAHAALIYFEIRRHVSEEFIAEIRERAEQVHAEAAQQEGATHFGALAVKHSDDQATRYLGGDIAWVEAGQTDSRWDPAVIAAIFSLEAPGELAPVVQAPNGLYVIRLLEKKAESLRPLADVAAAIKHQLLAEKRRRRGDELHAAAASRVQVEVHEDRLPAAAEPDRAPEGRPGPPAVPQLK